MDKGLLFTVIAAAAAAISAGCDIRNVFRERAMESPGRPQPRRYLTGAVLWALVAWAAVGFDYWDRHFRSQQGVASSLATVADQAVLLGWGSPMPFCTASINGATLMELRDKYAVAFVCGLPQDGVDKFEDKKVTVSPLYTIRAEAIPIRITYGPEMKQYAEEDLKKTLELKGMSEVPQGTTVTNPQWYEVVVLPKQIDVSDIHRLSDVIRYGGKILSQEGYKNAGVGVSN